MKTKYLAILLCGVCFYPAATIRSLTESRWTNLPMKHIGKPRNI